MKNKTTSVSALFSTTSNWNGSDGGEELKCKNALGFTNIRLCGKEIKLLFPNISFMRDLQYMLKVSKLKHLGAVSIDLLIKDGDNPRWFKGETTRWSRREFGWARGDGNTCLLFGGIGQAVRAVVRLFYGQQAQGGRVWISFKKV